VWGIGRGGWNAKARPHRHRPNRGNLGPVSTRERVNATALEIFRENFIIFAGILLTSKIFHTLLVYEIVLFNYYSREIPGILFILAEVKGIHFSQLFYVPTYPMGEKILSYFIQGIFL